MYEKKMNGFRNKIINGAVTKLNKNELEINSKNKNYLSILGDFVSTGSSKNEYEIKKENIKKVNNYLDNLKKQDTFFGGSIKFNNKTNIKIFKDKENEMTNMLICLDDDYKDSLFCEKTNDYNNVHYYCKFVYTIYHPDHYH